jgi:hypothetical protein
MPIFELVRNNDFDRISMILRKRPNLDGSENLAKIPIQNKKKFLNGFPGTVSIPNKKNEGYRKGG